MALGLQSKRTNHYKHYLEEVGFSKGLRELQCVRPVSSLEDGVVLAKLVDDVLDFRTSEEGVSLDFKEF